MQLTPSTSTNQFSVNIHLLIRFNGAIIIAALIMSAVELPFMTKFFDVTELDGAQWLVVLIAGICMILIVEIVKFFQRKAGKE